MHAIAASDRHVLLTSVARNDERSCSVNVNRNPAHLCRETATALHSDLSSQRCAATAILGKDGRCRIVRPRMPNPCRERSWIGR